MRKEIIEIEAKIGEAVNDIKKLYEEVRKTVVAGEEVGEKVSKGVEDIGKASKKSAKGVEGISKSVRGIGTAMKAAGIGIIIGLFSQLKEIFTSNQKVANALSAVTETISLVFNEFANTIVTVYEAVSKSTGGFDALGKVLSGILTIAITPLKLGFYGIKLGIQEAQLVWEKSFFGGNDKAKITELNAGIIETKMALYATGEAAVEAGKDIGKNIVEAVGEVTEFTTKAIEEVNKISVKGAYESAKNIVRLRNEAAIAVEIQAGLVEKNDRLAEQQRQIRDNDLKSIDVRKKANEELLRILKQQDIDMTKQAKLQTAAAQADYNKNQSTENYTALLAAQNNELGIKAQIEGFLSEQDINRIALIKEETELTNSKLESESTLSIEKKRFNAEQIENRLQNLEANKEIDALEQERESARLQAIIDNANEGTQAKVDAQIALDKFTEQSRQTNITRDKDIENTKLAMVTSTLGNISKAFGESSKAGKAAAVAASLINTYQGITAELATKTVTPFGFALKLANVATTAAIGFKSVKNILKTDTKNAGGNSFSTSVSTPRAEPQQAQAPSFNVVGSSGVNQLAGAIGSQTQQPIKAYVSSNDITTAQSMDRNIIAGATIG